MSKDTDQATLIRTIFPEEPRQHGHTETINYGRYSIAPEEAKRLKAAFSRRLRHRLMKKNMSQSDLARAIKAGRDSISTYARGRSLPGPRKMEAIAEALDTTVKQLLPELTELTDETTPPETTGNASGFEISEIPEEPGHAWLKVNRKVTHA